MKTPKIQGPSKELRDRMKAINALPQKNYTPEQVVEKVRLHQEQSKAIMLKHGLKNEG